MGLPKMENLFVLDDLIDGLWDLDIKNNRVYLSLNASKLFGHDQAVTLKCEELLNTAIHVDYKDIIKDEIGQLVRNRRDIVDTEIKVKSVLNEWKWVHCRAKSISRGTDGSPNRLLGSVTDISRFKIAEEEIRKERKMLRSIIDNLPVAIFIIDSKGRKILSNKTDYGINGANEESEVLGKTELELFPGETGERGHKDNLDVINNIVSIINREETFFDKDGNQKWLSINKIPLFNHDNQILGLIGIGIDITDQKKYQQKITESETLYRTLINITPDGVVVIDLNGKIIFISERTYQNFKIPTDKNLIGESIFDWVAPESLAIAKAYFKEAIVTTKPVKSLECKFNNYHKDEFWAEMSASPLLDYSRKTIGLMVVGHDLTDRKKIEEDLICAKNKAEENNKLKTAFLQNISHEIRTPLNAIVGFSSLLDDLSLSKDQHQSYIEIINKKSDHLVDIINGILEVSHIEAGILNTNENELDMNELIENLFIQFKLESERKNIQLKRSFGIQNIKVIIRSDKTKLVQILSNLLSNSLKFTVIGTIEFGYKIEGDNVLFFVSDTGSGIPQNQFNNIFDRFYQVEPPNNNVSQGTGVGLAICKAYVELLGGHIWLTSKVGVGSTFYFTIPFKQMESSNLV